MNHRAKSFSIVTLAAASLSVVLQTSCGDTKMTGDAWNRQPAAPEKSPAPQAPKPRADDQLKKADVNVSPAPLPAPVIPSPTAAADASPVPEFPPASEPTAAPTVVALPQATATPEVLPLGCDVAGVGALKHGQVVKRTKFRSPLVFGVDCESEVQTGTCNNGAFSWSGHADWFFDSCQRVDFNPPPAPAPTQPPSNPLLERRARYWKECTFNAALPLCEPARVWCADGASTSSGCRMATGTDVPNTQRGSPCASAGSLCRNAGNAVFKCTANLTFDDATNNKCQAPGYYLYSPTGAKFHYNGNGHFCYFLGAPPAGAALIPTNLEPNAQGYVSDGRCTWDK